MAGLIGVDDEDEPASCQHREARGYRGEESAPHRSWVGDHRLDNVVLPKPPGR
jgi:hypothetical protein